jgi:hypothetical protein
MYSYGVREAALLVQPVAVEGMCCTLGVLSACDAVHQPITAQANGPYCTACIFQTTFIICCACMLALAPHFHNTPCRHTAGKTI